LRATPHRVAQRINASSSRFSFPYFYDPSFEAEMQSVSIHFGERDLKLAEVHRSESGAARWDAQDPSLFRGPYGNYLLKKVAKVFPLLAERHALV
jgi:isopenicillin N synthase-like dioxygenase